jgi:hypothetical protein
VQKVESSVGATEEKSNGKIKKSYIVEDFE